MNKIKYLAILLIIGVITFIVFNSNTKTNKETILGDVVGTNIYSLNDAGDICSEINKASNSKLKIGITTPYKYTGSGNTAYVGGTSTYSATETYDEILTDLGSTISNCSNKNYPTTGYAGAGLTNITKANIETNGYIYRSWARFAKVSDKYMKIEDVEVKKPGSQPNRYNYLEIQNRNLDYTGKDDTPSNERKVKSYYTLKPGERIFLDIDVSEYNYSADNSKDLRATINYGVIKGDVSIHNQRSITYYLYAIENYDGPAYRVYGPFEMDISNLINKYTMAKNPEYTEEVGTLTEYSLISENLLKNVPNNTNVTIKKIRIYPYGNYEDNKESFKLFSLSIDLYDEEYLGKDYIPVTTVENNDSNIQNADSGEYKIRHNIVNNMMNMATIKWRGQNSRKYLIYYEDGRGPFEVSSNQILYGMPYVAMRMSNSTIYSFLANTTKAKDDPTINVYKTGTTYWADVTPNTGEPTLKDNEGNEILENGKVVPDPIVKGKQRPFTIRIINDNFDLFEFDEIDQNGGKVIATDDVGHKLGSHTDEVVKTLKNYGLYCDPKTEDCSDYTEPVFVNNKGGTYLQGVSCSSSAGGSYGPEVPYKTYISAENYFASSQVSLIGDIEITGKEVNDVLLALETQNSNVITTVNNYYTSVLQSKYGLDKLYEAYALTLPGDLIAHPGHVELLTGRTYVECKTNGATWHTQNYTRGFCDTHGGINPETSYVIKTSLGGSTYEFKGGDGARDDAAYVENGDGENDDEENGNAGNGGSNTKLPFVLKANTGWSYQLNEKYTDLTDIDEIYTNQNVKAGIGVNLKRTFADMLYDNNSSLLGLMTDAKNGTANSSIYNVVYHGNTYRLYSSYKVAKHRMYLPYRLKGFEKIRKGLVERPSVKLILDKEYNENEQNTVLFNYLKDHHTLKGLFSVNYMINAIKVNIKGMINDKNEDKTYYMYPDQGQGTVVSLATDFSDEINDDFSNLDYNNPVEIKISFNMGPNLQEVKDVMQLDEEGYFEVLRIQSPKYVVSFDSDGGSSVIDQTISENGYATAPTNPTREGHTFVEWQLNGQTFDFNTPVTSNITLTALWSINKYTVTFDSNGGSSVSSQTIDYNGKASKPSNPTQTGYTFVEWQLNDNSYNFNTPVTNNITLTAIWEENIPNKYIVAFNSNGGSNVDSQIVDHDGKASEPSNPTQTGYTFVEWQLNGQPYDFNTAVTSNITLVAIWTPVKYTVTFDSNGGTAVSSQSIDYNGKVSKPSNPTKVGHTFKEWQLNGHPYDFNTVITGNITLTALWTVNKYTVTFNSNGGSNVDSQIVDHDGKASEPSNPTQTGYTFVEWQLNGHPYDFNTAVTSNITLVAIWTPVKYTVTFDSNGGSSVSSQSIDYNGKVIVPSNPTKVGHTFKEWQINGHPFDFNTVITGNITLTALWTVNKYTVTFNSNGGSNVSSQTINYNERIIPPINPTREGYTFKEWQLNGQPFSFLTNVTSNITLTALWEENIPNKYTVTFNSNGGSSVDSQVIDYNGKASKPSNPTQTGYRFKEWQLNGNPYDFNTIVTGNITLMAIWIPNQYTVTFNSNGGSSVSSQTVNYNERIIPPINPTREGYTFKEWQLNGQPFSFLTNVTSNITLTAAWNKINTPTEASLKNILQSNGYSVASTYVFEFNIGDSISSIKNKLGNGVTIESKTNIISTGTVIKKGNESYTVVIKGDLNGDGKANSGDLLQMRKYLLEEINLSGAYKEAGIIESKGNIKSLDLLRLRQYLLGEYKLN